MLGCAIGWLAAAAALLSVLDEDEEITLEMLDEADEDGDVVEDCVGRMPPPPRCASLRSASMGVKSIWTLM